MDIIKYSAMLWVDRKNGHCEKSNWKTMFIATFTAVFVLAMQSIILITLNMQSGEFLFCGDIIRNIDLDPDNPSELFID